MAITGLDHVNVATQDIDATRDFWVDVLGLTVGWRPDFSFRGYWLYVGERAVVHVQETEAEVAASTASTLNHVAFAVSELDPLLDKLKARGVAWRESNPPGSDIRQVFFFDPNGVRVELDWRP